MTGNGLRELTMDKNHFGMLSVGYHITDKRKTTDSDRKITDNAHPMDKIYISV